MLFRSFEPDCELSLLLEQKKYMGLYLNRLEVRAEVEGIGLEALKDGSETGNHPCAYQAPTLTQPNEPLTLEKLENMEDTTPVWWDQINSWVLVYKGNLTTWSGKHLYAKGCNGKFYRRPPEGEEETP